MTGFVLKFALTPRGRLEFFVKVTGALNPFWPPKETVKGAELPCVTVWDSGSTERVKSWTVKILSALLATPLTVTITGPVVAPAGTGVTICVLFQLVAVPALIPLNVTVLVPWVAPNSDPVIVTGVSTAPEVGEIVLITGAFGTQMGVE